MSKPWTDADARRLKDLRLRAGLDRATFARRCTLSIAQLTELEEGPAGPSRFYGERIKSHTGHNALARLGYQPPPAQVAPEPEPEVTRTSPIEADTPAPALPPESPVPDIAPPPSAAPEDPPRSRRGRWLSAAALVMAAGVVLVLLADPQQSSPSGQAPQGAAIEPPSPAEPSAAASQAVPPPAHPVASPVILATADAAAAPPALAPASTASAAPAASQSDKASLAAPHDAAPARCESSAEATSEFTPPRAVRAANYVFLQAGQPIAVCVVDARNQQTQATVKPGEGLTVTGEAPFTIHTAHWGGLRVFFQGVRVQLDGPTPQSVVLRAR